MLKSPLDYQFWVDEYDLLARGVQPAMLTVLFAGAKSGVKALPSGIQVLADWDWFNNAAVAWLEAYGGGTLASINATTQKSVSKIITSWIQSGRRLDVLKTQLSPWVGPERASRIAVTEVTRAYAEGNVLAWKSTGYVSGKRWMTGVDDRVCPICAPLHGMEVGLDENGFTTEAFRLGLYAPPAHPNCRCFLQPIVSEELLGRRIDEVLNR
jgi:SPP1 gp7 family putative phage head morphogenesis protein